MAEVLQDQVHLLLLEELQVRVAVVLEENIHLLKDVPEQLTLVVEAAVARAVPDQEMLADQALLLFNIQVLKKQREEQFHVSRVRHNIYLIVQPCLQRLTQLQLWL